MADPKLHIPNQGMDKQLLLAQMESLRQEDAKWEDARTWSLVFHQSDAHTEFMKSAHNMFFDANGLNPMAFKSLKRFESDVVRMTANLLHGDEEVVGTMTSGGTESIMLAVRTYRDRARVLKPYIKKPEMIVPDSVHVAFDKAGKYFDVKMVHAPLEKDYRVNMKAVKRRITANTIALVGSAPCYPYGTIDPIEELGALAAKYSIGCHVDACVGGFFLPFLEEIGADIAPFDYRVPGVTSISADLHKYGYAAKGASTITYRNMDYLKHQFFVYVDWPGGVFASPSMPGTRPGGAIAAAWAALQAIGKEGYLKNTRTVMETVKQLRDGITAIPELTIVGAPPASLFAYRSTTRKINIFAVGDYMEAKGWHIDRQSKPNSLHMMVNPNHAVVVDQYLEDLKDAVLYLHSNKKANLSGSAPTYGLMFKAPTRGLIKKNVMQAMQDMYSAKGEVPDFGAAPGEVPQGIPKPVFTLMKVLNWFR